MLLSSPKAPLITFSKTRLIKFYLNSLLMTDPICLKWHIPVHVNDTGSQVLLAVHVENLRSDEFAHANETLPPLL